MADSLDLHDRLKAAKNQQIIQELKLKTAAS